MYQDLPKLLNMSLTGSFIVLFVLLARLLLRKAPKIYSYALWAVVLFRLLCPVSFSAPVSLLGVLDAPAATESHTVEYISPTIVHDPAPSVDIPVTTIDDAINDALPQGLEQTVADPLEFPVSLLTLVWLTVMVGFALYHLLKFLSFYGNLVGSPCLRDNIYLSDYIDTPFVTGILDPKIYLPLGLSEQEQSYIILHEQHHIRRGDHIWKLLGFTALCIHWFNPLVWVSFVLASKDMEMSCDEAVLKKMGADIRADYSASLLSLATGRRVIAGAPLAFGAGDTKSRIKNALQWRDPPVWVRVAGAIACGVVVVLCAANPKEESLTAPEPFGHTYRVAEVVWGYPTTSSTFDPPSITQCTLTSDYALDVLEGSTWVYPGFFQETELTEDFDALFGSLPVSYEEYRLNNKNAWKCVVSDAPATGLFYLLEQTDGTLLLAQGSTAGREHSSHPEDWLQWVYRLERADAVSCKVQNENSTTDLGSLGWYADGSGINWETLHSATVYGSASLAFTVEDSPETLIVSEDYYVNHSAEDGGHPAVKNTTYTLYPASDGVFYLPVERRNNDNEYAVYSISYGEGLYALRIDFPFAADTSTVTRAEVEALFSAEYPDAAILDSVVAYDGAYELLGVVLYQEDPDSQKLAFVKSGGWCHPAGVGDRNSPVSPAEDAELTYLGDGSVSWLCETPDGLTRYRMDYSLSGDDSSFTLSTLPVTDTVAQGYYVTEQCLYLTPLSSTLYPDGDDGWHYLISADGLTITQGNHGTPTTYPVDWQWDDIPTFPTSPTYSPLILQGEDVRWQAIRSDLYLAQAGGQLLVVNLGDTRHAFTAIWSVFSLTPYKTAYPSDGYYVTGEQVYKSLSGGTLYPDGDNGMRYFLYDGTLTVTERATGSSVTYPLSRTWTPYPYEENPITPKIFLEDGVLWQSVTDTLALAIINGQLLVVDNKPELANAFTLVPDTGDIPTSSLVSAITEAVRDAFFHNNTMDTLSRTHYILLDTRELMYDAALTSGEPAGGQLTVVDLLALGMDFQTENGDLVPIREKALSMELTFEVQNEAYILVESTQEEADLGDYDLTLRQGCYTQAAAYFGIDTQAVIQGLLDTIASSPAASSNPGDYIAAHEVEYRQLLYYDDYTLRFIFQRFLAGGETGLQGHLMRQVLDDMAPESALRLSAETGQEYFDEWLKAAQSMSQQLTPARMENEYPAAWLALRMAGT